MTAGEDAASDKGTASDTSGAGGPALWSGRSARAACECDDRRRRDRAHRCGLPHPARCGGCGYPSGGRAPLAEDLRSAHHGGRGRQDESLDRRRGRGCARGLPVHALCETAAAVARPSFTAAGDPAHANALYEYFVSLARRDVPRVATGTFAADMKVELVNDGPLPSCSIPTSSSACRAPAKGDGGYWPARPQLGQLHPRGTLRSHFASKAAILASFDYLGGTLTVCTPVGGTIHGRG